MREKLSLTVTGILVLGLSLMLGCSQSEEAVVNEAVSEEASAADSDSLSIDDIVGNYAYRMPEEEGGDTYFEIRQKDGKCFIEYTGPYAYAGAEMEVLKKSPGSGTNDIEYSVKLYPFSTFSFLGEYWEGGGSECTITAYENGDVELSKGQPFYEGENMYLDRFDEGCVHEYILDAEPNTNAKEVIGTWRCTTEVDGITCENYLELTPEGEFYLISKRPEYPIDYYVGFYTTETRNGGLAGSIVCDRFASGNSPYEWTLGYDEKLNCPVIVTDYDYNNPLSYQDEDNLPYEKTEPGKGMNIKPGPGSREKEIEQMAKEYYNYDSDDDESAEGHLPTEDEIQRLEEAIIIFPINDKYRSNLDLQYSSEFVVSNWAMYTDMPEEYAGLKFETGIGKKPANFENATPLGEQVEYIRTDTNKLEIALQSFFKTSSTISRLPGFEYVIDDNYVTWWGPGYKENYGNSWVKWSDFDYTVEGNRITMTASKTWGDNTSTYNDEYEFWFDYDALSPYNYSLTYYEKTYSYAETSYDVDTITSFEKEIRDYVNNRATAKDCVELEAGTDGCDYARKFYYQGNSLVFAYYFNSKTGDVDNRYYFWNNCMYEWIEGSGNDDTNRVRHYPCDKPLDPRWKETQLRILEEAATYR